MKNKLCAAFGLLCVVSACSPQTEKKNQSAGSVRATNDLSLPQDDRVLVLQQQDETVYGALCLPAEAKDFRTCAKAFDNIYHVKGGVEVFSAKRAQLENIARRVTLEFIEQLTDSSEFRQYALELSAAKSAVDGQNAQQDFDAELKQKEKFFNTMLDKEKLHAKVDELFAKLETRKTEVVASSDSPATAEDILQEGARIIVMKAFSVAWLQPYVQNPTSASVAVAANGPGLKFKLSKKLATEIATIGQLDELGSYYFQNGKLLNSIKNLKHGAPTCIVRALWESPTQQVDAVSYNSFEELAQQTSFGAQVIPGEEFPDFFQISPDIGDKVTSETSALDPKFLLGSLLLPTVSANQALPYFLGCGYANVTELKTVNVKSKVLLKNGQKAKSISYKIPSEVLFNATKLGTKNLMTIGDAQAALGDLIQIEGPLLSP